MPSGKLRADQQSAVMVYGPGTNNCYQSNRLVLDRTAVSESDMPSGLFDELNV